MKRRILAAFITAPPIGMVHIDPIPSFHPPSLRNPFRIPTTDPMEDSDAFLDVTLRKAPDMIKYTMNRTKHGIPSQAPLATTTQVEQHMAVIPMGFFYFSGESDDKTHAKAGDRKPHGKSPRGKHSR